MRKIKMKELTKGDIFSYEKNGFVFVCVDNVSIDAGYIFVTTPDYFNDNDLYSPSSGGWEKAYPETFVYWEGNMS